MKLLILSLAFLFLMGCGNNEITHIFPRPILDEAYKVLNYNEIRYIYFELSYDVVNENREDLEGETYYCLQSTPFNPSYSYSDSKVGQVVAYVYANKEKEDFLYKVKGKITTPDIEEHRIYNGSGIDLIFNVPVSIHREELYIEFKNEKGKVLKTEIYPKSDTRTKEIFLDDIQCYWASALFE